MAKTDANPPHAVVPGRLRRSPRSRTEELGKSVKPKQFLHIDQSECIMCEGCVDICPWKCIHMLSTDSSRRGGRHRAARARPRRPRDLRGRRGRVHPLRPLRRPLPDRRDHHGQDRCGRPRGRRTTSATTSTATPTECGSRHRARPRPKTGTQQRERRREGHAQVRPARAGRGRREGAGLAGWTSIFRPGSIFRKGYTDSPRNRSYVIMNSVLYHLHPVKVKRHAVKVSYTLCLGGLSLLPVHHAHRHRHLLDVLLPAHRRRRPGTTSTRWRRR